MTVEEMIAERDTRSAALSAALATALAAANAVKGGTASASVSGLANDLDTELAAANSAVSTKGGTVIAQNLSRLPMAITSIPQGSSITVEPLSITENGTYTADEGKAYSPVTVNVPSGGNPNMFVYEVLTSTGTIDITHSLGVVPTHAAAICLDMDNPTAGIQKFISGITTVGSANGKVIYYTTAGVIDTANGGFTLSNATETSLRLTTTRNFYGGSTYLFIFA